MMDEQLNGALDFDFSAVPERSDQISAYAAQYRCQEWVKTCVTSFLPPRVTNPPGAF